MITFKHRGDFSKLENFLNRMSKGAYFNRILNEYGRRGVEALSAATPVDSGTTASSWRYEIQNDGNRMKIEWLNSNVNQGVNIALIIQLGHGTGTGGYVQGRDYINPAMQEVFDGFAEEIWGEVTKA